MMAGPAEATTKDCDYSHGTSYGSVYCYADSTGSQFRAHVTCRLNLTDGPTYTTVYGPWEVPGNRLHSLGQCPSGGWYYYSETADVK